MGTGSGTVWHLNDQTHHCAYTADSQALQSALSQQADPDDAYFGGSTEISHQVAALPREKDV